MLSIPLRTEVVDASTDGWGRALGHAALVWAAAMLGCAAMVDSAEMAGWGAVIAVGAFLGLAWGLGTGLLRWNDAVDSLYGWAVLIALGAVVGLGMGLAAHALIVGAGTAP
jgi:hypothetical protein